MSTNIYASDMYNFLTRQRMEPPVTPFTPDTSLEGQTIIITGANTGLGLEACRHLVRLHVSRLILAVRSLNKGRAAAQQLDEAAKQQQLSPTIEVWQLDMSAYASITAFATRARNELARLDTVFLNAGVESTEFKVLSGVEESIFVNVVGTLLLGELMLPQLRENAQRSLSPGSDALLAQQTASSVGAPSQSVSSKMTSSPRAHLESPSQPRASLQAPSGQRSKRSQENVPQDGGAQQPRKDTKLLFTGSMVHTLADGNVFRKAADGKMLETITNKAEKDMGPIYTNSKFLMTMGVRELAKCQPIEESQDGGQVIIAHVNPGWCATELFRDAKWNLGMRANFKIFGRTSEQGSRTLAHATAAAGRECHGKYLSECEVKVGGKWIENPNESAETQRRFLEELLDLWDKEVPEQDVRGIFDR